jgi:hypothetical protein
MDDMVTAFVALNTVQRTNSQQQATSTAEGAAAAAQAQAGLQRICHVLDLGCGIGSVLLMVAWGLRRMAMGQQHQQQHQEQQFAITSLGVEAQSISYQLAVRNIKYNLGADQQQVQVSRGWLLVGEGGHVDMFAYRKTTLTRVTLPARIRADGFWLLSHTLPYTITAHMKCWEYSAPDLDINKCSN